MAVFTSFQDVLPDPNNNIGNAGQATGSAGPGFASVKVTSEQPYISSRTNSGRLLARAKAYHKWKINIKYNPMTRAEFEPIYTFLLQRRGPLNPFYVSLPQYRTPQDSSFATHVASENLEATAAHSAGATIMTLDGSTYDTSADNYPSPGDMFTVNGTDSNHKKAYMVTRVETNADYKGTQPGADEARIHFVPGLAKAVANNDDIVFHNPLIKVVRVGNIEAYDLNTDNLYQFSLNLEEVQ